MRIKWYNDFMHKVKSNHQGVGVRNVEETVMDVLKQWYEDETQRIALVVRHHRRKRSHQNMGEDDDTDEEDECALGDIDAEDDLGVFAEV